MVKKKRKLRLRFKSAIKKRRMALAKSLTILPHIFTFGNAFFGFISLIFAVRGNFVSAGYCILIGALMDALDGRIARLVGSISSFGVELDSLCDVVSFCVAPAFLVYSHFLYELGPLGILVSATYLMAGIFRLARFNLISDQQTIYFLGLPTTAAACFLVAISLCSKYLILNENTLLLLFFTVLIVAILMISTVPFPTFKNRILGIKKSAQVAMLGGVLAFIAILRFKISILVLMSLYIVLSVGMYIFGKMQTLLKKS